MDPLQAIVLGIIQGLTEFLPVSSSGHLVIFQSLFGLKEPELLFNISVHIGTLVAIFGIFFKEIRSIILTMVRFPRLMISSGSISGLFTENKDIRIAGLIVIGSCPTALLGIFFNKIADQVFASVGIVGIMLLVTGSILWLTRNTGIEGRNIKNVTVKDAIIIGLVQGMAILPGISRSGSTISVALFLGVDRETAARYSFLLSIPAILGALLIMLTSSTTLGTASGGIMILGSLIAGVVGYFALKILLRLVKKGKLYRFAPYCWFAGAFALIWHWM